MLAGSPYHSVKLEAVLEAPIEHVLALAVEYDLTKTWNSYMKESVVLHAIYPFLSIIYGALWTPFFIIDVVVRADGYDLGEVRLCWMSAPCAAVPLWVHRMPPGIQPFEDHLSSAEGNLCSWSSIQHHFWRTLNAGGQKPAGEPEEHK
jgi:hypothetical protein